MTLKEKVFKAFEIIHNYYLPLLTAESVGVYYHLLHLDSLVQAVKNISIEDICVSMKIDEERAKICMEELLEFELIKRSPLKKKVAYNTISPPIIISCEKKKLILKNMQETSRMGSEDIESYLTIIEEQEKFKISKAKAKEPESPVSNFNFNVGGVNPDTPRGLVRYFYRYLGETFGQVYRSHNELQESMQVKNTMEGNGDAPETTRSQFKYIIDQAKNGNRFDQVSSLKFYGNLRNAAHNALSVKGHGDAKFAKPQGKQTDADKMENIQKIYNRYTGEKGMTFTEAMRELKKSFDMELLKPFARKVQSGK